MVPRIGQQVERAGQLVVCASPDCRRRPLARRRPPRSRIAPYRAPSCSASRASAARPANTQTRARESRRPLSASHRFGSSEATARIAATVSDRDATDSTGGGFVGAVARSRSHQSLGIRCRLGGGTTPTRLRGSRGRAARRPDASPAAGRLRPTGPGARARSRPQAARRQA